MNFFSSQLQKKPFIMWFNGIIIVFFIFIFSLFALSCTHFSSKCTVSKNAFNSVFMLMSTMPQLPFQPSPTASVSHFGLPGSWSDAPLLLVLPYSFLLSVGLPCSRLSFPCLLAFAASHQPMFENRKANKQDMMGLPHGAVQCSFSCCMVEVFFSRHHWCFADLWNISSKISLTLC